MYKVFIDGEAGTTGLRLAERLSGRADIELLKIEEPLRKDASARLKCIMDSDVTFLCLPDEESVQIVEAVEKAEATCRIIDCSTAHRTAPGWSYGMSEIGRGAVSNDMVICEKDVRVSNPGCHSTGFIMAVRPLVDAGILDPAAQLYFHSLTGYSGGGKVMIADYEEAQEKDPGRLRAPRQYAFKQEHKHIPEIEKYAGLAEAPVFAPIVCDFYCGMLVSVPLPRSALRRNASVEDVKGALAAFYEGCPLVKIRALGDEFSEAAGAGYLAADAFAGRDDIEFFVTGKDDKIEIVSRYDNLGKGASGAAIQNMNILLGLPEETGLVLGT